MTNLALEQVLRHKFAEQYNALHDKNPGQFSHKVSSPVESDEEYAQRTADLQNYFADRNMDYARGMWPCPGLDEFLRYLCENKGAEFFVHKLDNIAPVLEKLELFEFIVPQTRRPINSDDSVFLVLESKCVRENGGPPPATKMHEDYVCYVVGEIYTRQSEQN